MAQRHPEIDAGLRSFIEAQPMFFVATAGPAGRVNLSPKGLAGSFAVLAENRVAFLNLTGSGNETAAHLRLDDRITVMFCAFGGPPRILRLYGRGRTIRPGAVEWSALRPHFSEQAGARQIIDIVIDEIITSCGYGVPLMDFSGHRETLVDWAARKGEEGLEAYWREKNAVSFDGTSTGMLEDE